jgi:hypothetical protein
MIPMPEQLFKLCKSMGLDILPKLCSWLPSQLLNDSIITNVTLILNFHPSLISPSPQALSID